ncbi:MAG: hypothetical protein OEV87_05370 [Phycisphaerae bacterium]|nr:hypothetical protein [Phycisphaerae bacterium]
MTPSKAKTSTGSSKKRGRRTSPSEAEKPLCFVIMPFGKEGSDEHEHYTTVYDHIIKRAIADSGFEPLRADEIPDSGPIPEEVKKRLRVANLVLADLSDRNPNVFYELGYRHALSKPLITIADDVSSIPFNLSPYRTIQYAIDDVTKADKARDLIIKYAKEIKERLKRPSQKSTKPVDSTMNSLPTLHDKVEQGFSNVYQILSEHLPTGQEQPLLKEILSQKTTLSQIQSSLNNVQNNAEAMVAASRLLQQTVDLGLVGIHATRMDAFEDYFFATMEREDKAIDIVGSTIFGLKGRHHVTRDRVLELLKLKKQQFGFKLRILLTHWEYISHRQDQEKTEKNITRYVISKELKEAVDLLKHYNLTDCVRFYQAAPTCFTVICRDQGLMLVNPYPYQREAYNSWTVIFREIQQGAVYSVFSEAHFEQPWDNNELAIPYSKECEKAVEEKLKRDLELAQSEMAATYKGEGQSIGKHSDGKK